MDAAQRAVRRRDFLAGVRDGVPIGLGYLAVAFSLGIAARSAGLNAFQGFLISLLNNASAGEYAAFTVIAADSGFVEMALITLITNARYLLMSCSLSQKFSPDTPLYHRLLVGYDVTDELFGIAIARPGYLDPFYSYGAFVPAIPGWASSCCRQAAPSAAVTYGNSRGCAASMAAAGSCSSMCCACCFWVCRS